MTDVARTKRRLELAGGMGTIIFGAALIGSQVASGWGETWLGAMSILSLVLLTLGSVMRP